MRLGFIGRFQPFHKGHLDVINQFSDRHEVVVIVADSGSRDQEDPLTAEERVKIVESCVPCEVFVQEDYPKNDNLWCKEVLQTSSVEGVITRNEWTKRAMQQHSDVEVFEQDMFNREIYSGTEIRTRIRSGDEWRYLVPDCALEALESQGLVSDIREESIDYTFKPGWKKEHTRN